MTNVNAEIIEIYPQAGADSRGRKMGYLAATAKAAKDDTITIKNVSTIVSAEIRVVTSTQENILITDDDNAASTGVAIYIHTKDGTNAWLEFVSPTDADGLITLNNGGSTAMVFDLDAAATDGVVVYVDDDGATQNERLLCISPSAKDLIVPIAEGNGKTIVFKHDASAASNGTQIYLDEDAGNSYERLLSVTAGDADTNGQTVGVAIGAQDTYTVSTNILTLTGNAIGTVEGFVYYR